MMPQVRRKHVPLVPTPSSSSGSSQDHVLHPVRVLEGGSHTSSSMTGSGGGGQGDDDDRYHTDDDVEDDDEQQQQSAAGSTMDRNHIIQVGAGFAHSAALTASGRLFLWGFGECWRRIV